MSSLDFFMLVPCFFPKYLRKTDWENQDGRQMCVICSHFQQTDLSVEELTFYSTWSGGRLSILRVPK